MIAQGAHLHFEPAELAARQGAVIDATAARGLAALVMFRQESMYWLTSYDTFGYVTGRCSTPANATSPAGQRLLRAHGPVRPAAGLAMTLARTSLVT
jgi:hypothetical protein